MLKPRHNVNVDIYCEQFDRVNQSLIEKCPEIIHQKMHYSARLRLHCALLTLEDSASPTPLNIGPADFRLFLLKFGEFPKHPILQKKQLFFIEILHTIGQKFVDNEGGAW